MSLFRNLLEAPRYARRYGLRAALKRGRGELAGLTSGSASGEGGAPVRPIDWFEHVLGREQGTGDPAVIASAPVDSIVWVIPDFAVASGGHTTILRFVRGLEALGWTNQTIVVQEPHRWASGSDALHAIRRNFGDLLHVTVALGSASIPPCRYLIATGWQTAYWVAKYRDAAHKLYLVQDYEPAFTPPGTEHIVSEGTYRLGLAMIAAGEWLKERLAREYGAGVVSVSFSCDHAVYRPVARRRAHSGRRVFFYARPRTPRRAFELGAMALRRLCERRGDVTAVLAGSDIEGYRLAFPHTNEKVVSPERLAELFNDCDAALVLSLTNLSLMPLEIMACGCPLVINRGANNEWLIDETAAWLCDLTVESIADTLNTVLDGGPEVEARRARGLALSQATSWDVEFRKLSDYLKTLS